MHLFVVRHAQSFVNLDDWADGFIDAGLTPLGQQQARRMAAWVRDHIAVDVMYVSTMARTQETAQFVTDETGIKALPDHRLREFGNCYASGLPVPPEAMPIFYPDFWGTQFPYRPISEVGESWTLFTLRVSAFMTDLVARHGDSTQNVMVVCHGGVIEAIFDHIFNLGLRERQVEILTHNTAIDHWEYRGSATGREPWRLHAHGLAQHLVQESAQWLGSKPLLRAAARPLADAGDD